MALDGSLGTPLGPVGEMVGSQLWLGIAVGMIPLGFWLVADPELGALLGSWIWLGMVLGWTDEILDSVGIKLGMADGSEDFVPDDGCGDGTFGALEGSTEGKVNISVLDAFGGRRGRRDDHPRFLRALLCFLYFCW